MPYKRRGEFGDHPDAAVARMRWALATINAVYPAPLITPARRPAVTCLRELIVAS